jgi:hypothetical protein
MRGLRIILAMACLPVWPVLLGQTAQTPVTLTQQDLVSAQWNFEHSFLPPNQTLYNAPVAFPDGARGYQSWGSSESLGNPFSSPGDAPAPPTADTWQYCDAASIVVAHETASSTMLSPDKRGIYTATRFTIEQVVKNDIVRRDKHKPGDEVTLVEFGGTFRDDNGTLLRVENGPSQFHPDRSYLLFLEKQPAAHPSTAWFSFVAPVQVVHGNVLPNRRSADGAVPVSATRALSFDAYWRSFRDDFSVNGCYAIPTVNTFYPFPVPSHF